MLSTDAIAGAEVDDVGCRGQMERIGEIAATEAFYGVALTLLPALLFGGAVIAVPARSTRAKAAVVVIVGVLYVALVLALQGTIDPAGADYWRQRVIAFVLVAGTLSASLAAWLSQPATPTDEVQTAARTHYPQTYRLTYRLLIGAVGLVLAVGAATVGITDSLDHAAARSRLARADRIKSADAAALTAAETQAVATRAAAISTLLDVSPETDATIGDEVRVWIQQADKTVQPILESAAPKPAKVNQADQALRVSSNKLKKSLTDDLELHLEAANVDPRAFGRVANEAWLVSLAAAQLASAERTRLAAKARGAASQAAYQLAQNDPDL